MSTTNEKPVAWITGASSGLGKALVKEFYAQGYNIVLSGRHKESLWAVTKEFGLSNLNSLILPLDLEKPYSLLDLPKQVKDHFGSIDVMIHNGGISQRSSFAEMKYEVMEKIISTNLLGSIALTKSLLPIFQKQRTGQIIVISSIQGKVPLPNRTGYSASKHALHGFFESLRLEIPFLKILMVCPGYINTNLSKNAVTGNGDNQGITDINQAKGLDANKVAKEIFSAMKKEKKTIFPAGIKEKTALFLQKTLPFFLRKLLEVKA